MLKIAYFTFLEIYFEIIQSVFIWNDNVFTKMKSSLLRCLCFICSTNILDYWPVFSSFLFTASSVVGECSNIELHFQCSPSVCQSISSWKKQITPVGICFIKTKTFNLYSVLVYGQYCLDQSLNANDNFFIVLRSKIFLQGLMCSEPEDLRGKYIMGESYSSVDYLLMRLSQCVTRWGAWLEFGHRGATRKGLFLSFSLPFFLCFLAP